MLVNTRRLVIEWGDCDPAGIVFYPRYFAMFDASTAALFARAFGDEVRIETTVTEFRRASFDVRHRLLRDDGNLAVEGFETRVWVGRHPDNPDGIKALPL